MNNPFMNGFLDMTLKKESSSAFDYEIPNNIPKETKELMVSFMNKYNIKPKIYTDVERSYQAYHVPDTRHNRSVGKKFDENPDKYTAKQRDKFKTLIRPGIHIPSQHASPAPTLHELAHVVDYKNAPDRKALINRTVSMPVGILTGTGMFLAGLRFPKLRKWSPLPVGVGALPTMYEESKASVLATKHLMEEQDNSKGLKTGLKELAPGLLSYLVLPGLMAGSLVLGHRRLKNNEKIIEKLRNEASKYGWKA